jgi:hypothetical protein
MLTKLQEIEPLAVIGFGIAIVGSILGIIWYRTTAPNDFDRGSVKFIIMVFLGIGIGTVILGALIKN